MVDCTTFWDANIPWPSMEGLENASPVTTQLGLTIKQPPGNGIKYLLKTKANKTPTITKIIPHGYVSMVILFTVLEF